MQPFICNPTLRHAAQRNIQNPLLRPTFTAFLAPELLAMFAASLDRPSHERPEPSAERPVPDAAATEGLAEGAEMMEGDHGTMDDGPGANPTLTRTL